MFPDLERAELVQQLACPRPLSPDSKPIIGPAPGWDGILLATGHTTKGIHLGRSPAGSSPTISAATQPWSFLPDRFADFGDADRALGSVDKMVT